MKDYASTLNYTAALCRSRSKAHSLTARKRQEQILSYSLASEGRGCIRHTRAISFPSLSLCINLKIEIIQMAEMSPPAAAPARQGLVNHIEAIQSSSKQNKGPINIQHQKSSDIRPSLSGIMFNLYHPITELGGAPFSIVHWLHRNNLGSIYTAVDIFFLSGYLECQQCSGSSCI